MASTLPGLRVFATQVRNAHPQLPFFIRATTRLTRDDVVCLRSRSASVSACRAPAGPARAVVPPVSWLRLEPGTNRGARGVLWAALRARLLPGSRGLRKVLHAYISSCSASRLFQDTAAAQKSARLRHTTSPRSTPSTGRKN